jgi:hypothetical protein
VPAFRAFGLQRTAFLVFDLQSVPNCRIEWEAMDAMDAWEYMVLDVEHKPGPDARSVPFLSLPVVNIIAFRPWYQLPFVIDNSALQMLLVAVTAWLDRR